MDICFKEFFLKARAYTEEGDISYKRDWERTRWASYITIQPHIKKNAIKQPKDLLEFQWEKKKVKKVKTQFQKMSPEERHEWLLKKWK